MSELTHTNNTGEPLTAAEIAPLFKVSKRTVLNWHNDGIIPAEIAVGRVIRFDAARVRDALRVHSAR